MQRDDNTWDGYDSPFECVEGWFRYCGSVDMRAVGLWVTLRLVSSVTRYLLSKDIENIGNTANYGLVVGI